MSFSAGLQRKRTHVPIRFGRSLLMVRPLRAGTSSASPQAVERPVKGFTQPVHRNVWTPLENRGKIVDMTGVAALFATAAALVSPSRAIVSTQLPSLPV